MKHNKELFSGSLTFLSILLGVFTFALMNAIKWKGLDAEKPWMLLVLVTSFGIFSCSLISIISFYSLNRYIPNILEKMVYILMYAVLIISGFGTPIVGLWLYF